MTSSDVVEGHQTVRLQSRPTKVIWHTAFHTFLVPLFSFLHFPPPASLYHIFQFCIFTLPSLQACATFSCLAFSCRAFSASPLAVCFKTKSLQICYAFTINCIRFDIVRRRTRMTHRASDCDMRHAFVERVVASGVNISACIRAGGGHPEHIYVLIKMMRCNTCDFLRDNNCCSSLPPFGYFSEPTMRYIRLIFIVVNNQTIGLRLLHLNKTKLTKYWLNFYPRRVGLS